MHGVHRITFFTSFSVELILSTPTLETNIKKTETIWEHGAGCYTQCFPVDYWALFLWANPISSSTV